ncbi:MAG: PQQ-binding-like beta-propeller repeat protein [Rubripirellula sp.]|nr:PQQ-binding-like beta-propeller repeat protein [Rubripirellula sp.]
MKSQINKSILLLIPPLILTLFTPPTARGGDGWTSFRNGGASLAKSSLPTEWSPNEGIAWQHELAGYGQSAPVIIDGKVFVSSVAGSMCEQLVLQCFDLTSGDSLWQYERPTSTGHPSNYMNARAAPTPLVDDDAVYAFFETGDFVCLDHAGNLRWHRNEAKAFGKFGNNHGLGSSPAMDDQNLYLLTEHDGPSFLSAINKKTGETAWQTTRASTKSWASPIVAQVSDRDKCIVVSSGGTVTGYSAADGTQEWQIDGIEGNSVPSPTTTENFLLVGARLPEFATDGQVQANCCLDLSQITDGEPRVVWRADKAICNYASPVTCNGYAYFMSKANVLHCVEIASGEMLYRKRLSLDCWATPVVCDDAIYFFGKNGQTRILQGGSEFTEIASNSLWNADAPPAPESYAESTAGHGGSGHGGGHGKGESKKGGSARSGGMIARMMAGDANQDGMLEGDEIGAMFRPMMPRIDTDGDGKINQKELEAMAKSFAERRSNSAASARDPIVYGVAAADGRIVVRTGTRLYVIDGK